MQFIKVILHINLVYSVDLFLQRFLSNSQMWVTSFLHSPYFANLFPIIQHYSHPMNLYFILPFSNTYVTLPWIPCHTLVDCFNATSYYWCHKKKCVLYTIYFENSQLLLPTNFWTKTHDLFRFHIHISKVTLSVSLLTLMKVSDV